MSKRDNDNDDYENDDHDSDKLIRTIKKTTPLTSSLFHHTHEMGFGMIMIVSKILEFQTNKDVKLAQGPGLYLV